MTVKTTYHFFRVMFLVLLLSAWQSPPAHAQGSMHYQQDFSGFVFPADTEVLVFGDNGEWTFDATGSHADRLNYRGDWGTGVSAGFRGNDNVMGYQHTAATGIFYATLTLTNTSGETITLIDISYTGRVERAGEGRSPEWTVEVNGQVVPELGYSTASGTDQEKSAQVSVNIAPGGELVIVWSSDRGQPSGASKQIGIADLVIAAGEATQVAAPVFDPPAGLYFEAQDVNITSLTDGASIHYTLDGSEPTENDFLFDAAIPVDQDMTIKARAFLDGLDPSDVVTAEYTIRSLVLWKDFEDGDLFSGNWTVYDILPGANTWGIDDFDNITYAMITEFGSDPEYPHSWYISPQINLDGLEDVMMSFYSQAAFRTGEALSVHISADYPGSGDPTNYTWSALDADLDPHTGGGFGSWTYSGEISLEDFDGNIHIGFQYHSDADNFGRWHLNDILVVGTEPGQSGDNSLAVFTVGGINVLNLGGLEVDDPETDPGAILYVEDFFEFGGIEVVPNDDLAQFSVSLNGAPVDQADLPDQPIEFEDVIVVTVTAENGSIAHYKLTALGENRILVILTPEEGDEFFTYDDMVFSWEAENLDQLLFEVFMLGLDDPVESLVLPADLDEVVEPVANGIHGTFFYKLTDNNDPSFYVESGHFQMIDNVDPSLTDQYPEPGALDVELNPSLMMAFDEAFIFAGAGSIHIYNENGDQLIESIAAGGNQVSIDEAQVHITLSAPLAYETTYYVLVDGNAFVDMAGNFFEGIEDSSQWSFTTLAESDDFLICNGDFEDWSDGLPHCWYGEKSNIGVDNVVQYSANPHTGSYAVQLINATSDHRRFTSQPTSVESGTAYSITFWAKGRGDIRTGLFDDRDTGFGYAPYNSYVIVDSDSWAEYSQVVTAATNSDIAEFIFSLRNTGEAMNHLQIDHVSVEVLSDDPIEVSSIAQLRNGQMGALYTLTGEVVLTYQMGHRNQKFIQDDTAGILIDDNDGIITTAYERYDGITGLTGTLTAHNQMLQLVPAGDPGAPTSSGNVVTPLERSLPDIGSDDQGRLIVVDPVLFMDAGDVFATGTNYDIVDLDGNTMVFRTLFFDADYIGSGIPGGRQELTALVSQFMETMQLTARDWNDIQQSVDIPEVGEQSLQVYPNPFGNRLSVRSNQEMAIVRILDSHGRLVLETEAGGMELEISTSGLKAGIYILQIINDDGSLKHSPIIRQ